MAKKLPFHPWYNQSSFVFWFIWIWFTLFLIGTVIYLGLFVMNLSSVYTWFKNPGSPGTQLTSKRGTFEDVAVRLSIIGNIFTLVIICSWIMFRTNFGCNILWVIFYAIAVLMTLLGILGLGRMYSECNGQFQYGNLCNDQRWCCATEIYSKPLNGCPNTLPCAVPVPVEDLKPNQDFLGLFWLNVCLFAFQCAMIILFSVYWTLSKPEKEEEDESDFAEIPSAPPLPQEPEPESEPKESRTVHIEPTGILYHPKNKSHGLRERRKK